MIERLSRALDHVEELPVDAQEAIARQIEVYSAASTPFARTLHNFAGIWSDLPDDMEETLMRWRHESEPSAPLDDLSGSSDK
ncbi:MAG TPA: hypothetical protein VJO13_19025 [Ktedonobacterales bacterium]|nr:hypothetical protein [Ktedonobacterales bacterium]